MSNPGPTKEEYDSPLSKLATLESELSQSRKLLEAPSKISLWRRLWGMGSKAVVVALVALLLLPGVSYALTNQQKALVGLKGVEVAVEGMNPQAERLGLTKAQIQTDVELRLRKAGVRVLTDEESLGTPGSPWLYVNVGTFIRSGSALCAYGVEVVLNEMVTLARGFKTVGGIWHTGNVGTVGTSNIREIRKDVGDQVDKFINDYLAANPKK